MVDRLARAMVALKGCALVEQMVVELAAQLVLYLVALKADS